MKVTGNILTVIVLFLQVGCQQQKQNDDEAPGVGLMSEMVHLTKHQQELINLRVDTATVESMYLTADYVGIVAIDENNIHSVRSRVNGRIDQLFVRNPGEEVIKGEALYSIYSEELLSDENEFLLALEQQVKFPNQKEMMDAFVEASRRKLLLWGLSDDQINELARLGEPSPTVVYYSETTGSLLELYINEGEYVATGTPVFSIASLETVWVSADIYQNEISHLLMNPIIELRFEALSNEIYTGQIIQDPPVLEPDKKVAVVNIVVQNGSRKIKPGMMATISINRTPQKTLVIPKTALVLGKMTSVWIEVMPGMYENRMVETGMENKTRVEIISGLEEGEKVVTSGSYLLNSAYILQNGANSMAGMEM